MLYVLIVDMVKRNKHKLLVVSGLTCSYRDSCQSGPCGIHARCEVDAYGQYSCICHSGYNGTNCDQDINECYPNNGPCGHGTCVNTNGSYYCNCKVGYTGKYIQQCYTKRGHRGIDRLAIDVFQCISAKGILLTRTKFMSLQFFMIMVAIV